MNQTILGVKQTDYIPKSLIPVTVHEYFIGSIFFTPVFVLTYLAWFLSLLPLTVPAISDLLLLLK